MTGVATIPREPLRGEALLSDFKAAKEIAATIGGFKSWKLPEREREATVRSFQRDLAAHALLIEMDPGGMLADAEEEARILELAEKSRQLDLGRYIGVEATVITTERFRIVPFVPVNFAQNPKQRHFKEGGRGPAVIDSVAITSIHPEASSINIGEGRLSTDPDAPRIDSGFWRVYPFDMYGKPAVSFNFDQPTL